MGVVTSTFGGAIARRPWRTFDVQLFVYLALQSRYFGRWLMPVFPFVCILASYAVLELAVTPDRHRGGHLERLGITPGQERRPVGRQEHPGGRVQDGGGRLLLEDAYDAPRQRVAGAVEQDNQIACGRLGLARLLVVPIFAAGTGAATGRFGRPVQTTNTPNAERPRHGAAPRSR
mgnify:CR=1 FL=1